MKNPKFRSNLKSSPIQVKSLNINQSLHHRAHPDPISDLARHRSMNNNQIKLKQEQEHDELREMENKRDKDRNYTKTR